jgi:hypothetical protein
MPDAPPPPQSLAPGLLLPLALGLALAAAHLGLAAWDLAHPPRPATTYVFTPLVDVWPEGPALTAEEGRALGPALRGGIDAREISQAYARMGSTLSLAELLVGVEALQREGALGAAQQAELARVLDAARADHEALVETQAEILELERRIGARVSELQAQAGVELPARPGPPSGPPAPAGRQ